MDGDSQEGMLFFVVPKLQAVQLKSMLDNKSKKPAATNVRLIAMGIHLARGNLV